MKKNTLKYNNQSSIVLIGMMGVGKTSIGRLLSEEISYHFMILIMKLKKN